MTSKETNRNNCQSYPRWLAGRNLYLDSTRTSRLLISPSNSWKLPHFQSSTDENPFRKISWGLSSGTRLAGKGIRLFAYSMVSLCIKPFAPGLRSVAFWAPIVITCNVTVPSRLNLILNILSMNFGSSFYCWLAMMLRWSFYVPTPVVYVAQDLCNFRLSKFSLLSEILNLERLVASKLFCEIQITQFSES